MRLQDSPVHTVRFRDRIWYIKRDDLLQPFPGNKVRKLQGLLEDDWRGIEELVSCGGNQSNAMLALARLANHLGVSFRYYTRPLPRWLSASPIGNLAQALTLGMELIESQSLPTADDFSPSSRFVPQGAAMPQAEVGLRQLAEELVQFITVAGLREPLVFLPSGTGASAYFLQRNLDCPVLTTPCVGDEAYLKRQFRQLGPPPDPRILSPLYRHPFGQLRAQYLQLWQELRDQTGIEFDLLYDPPGWSALLAADLPGTVIYLHCGGVEGNASMLARYRRGGMAHTTARPRLTISERNEQR